MTTTTPRKTTPRKTGDRTLLITEQCETGTRHFELTIPASAKITYGLLHPGTKLGAAAQQKQPYNSPDTGLSHSYTEGHVLRIYEGTTQTAVFRHVVAFRDLGYTYKVVGLAGPEETPRQVPNRNRPNLSDF